MPESQVYLRKMATGKLVDAILWDEVTDEHLALWSGVWQPAMQAYCAGRSLRDKPEDHHWNWRWKAKGWRLVLGYHSFAITCEGALQGLMLLDDMTHSSRISTQFGKPLVYVVFWRQRRGTGRKSKRRSVTAVWGR